MISSGHGKPLFAALGLCLMPGLVLLIVSRQVDPVRLDRAAAGTGERPNPSVGRPASGAGKQDGLPVTGDSAFVGVLFSRRSNDVPARVDGIVRDLDVWP